MLNLTPCAGVCSGTIPYPKGGLGMCVLCFSHFRTFVLKCDSPLSVPTVPDGSAVDDCRNVSGG